NQQARVDVITTTANPFSVAPADVLQTLFRTKVGDPLVSGYSTVTTDLTAFFNAHAGQTVRLRFAEVDNQFYFQFGVDRVTLTFGRSTGGSLPSSSGAATVGQEARPAGTNTEAADRLFATLGSQAARGSASHLGSGIDNVLAVKALTGVSSP